MVFIMGSEYIIGHLIYYKGSWLTLYLHNASIGFEKILSFGLFIATTNNIVF